MIICNLYFITLLLTQPQSPIVLTESQPISFIILLSTQQGNDLSPLFQYEYVHQLFYLLNHQIQGNVIIKFPVKVIAAYWIGPLMRTLWHKDLQKQKCSQHSKINQKQNNLSPLCKIKSKHWQNKRQQIFNCHCFIFLCMLNSTCFRSLYIYSAQRHNYIRN